MRFPVGCECEARNGQATIPEEYPARRWGGRLCAAQHEVALREVMSIWGGGGGVINGLVAREGETERPWDVGKL